MNKINIIIKDMENLYKELNKKDSNIDIEDVKKLQKFVKGYSCDLQELIYDIKNKQSIQSDR